MARIMGDIELEFRRSRTPGRVPFLPFVEKVSERYTLAVEESPRLIAKGRVLLQQGREDVDSPFTVFRTEGAADTEETGHNVPNETA